MKLQVKKYFGPSTLVTAAFIGPGTVTVCTLAGVNSGYSLLWALLFSVIATIVLQEMTARLGLITQKGFGEAIRGELQNPLFRIFGITLVLGAIVVGNAAYEGGNISGAVLGWNEILPSLNIVIEDIEFRLSPLIIGGIAFWLLYSGNFKRIQNFLVGLVVIMSVVFLATAIMIAPDISEIAKGLFVPKASSEEIITVIALIGTTVVPYNLFLHASSVQQKYTKASQLSDLRKENLVAIILGGVISICIVITSAASGSSGSEIKNAADMAIQLEPLLGSWAKSFLGLGLVAAGISSAITAPLAAAFAAKGILGWEVDMKHLKFKSVWITILVIGVLFSMLNFSPVSIIQFAQVANGILLPLVAVFLVYIVNRKDLLGEYVNSTLQNVLGGIVILSALLIGFRSLNNVFQLI
jgi:Mn2+/Fe2+ NRAMP family transporter